MTPAEISDQAKADGEPSSSEHLCPACAKPLASDASRCPNCGLALGEHQRCPRCHAIAAANPSPDARFVCAICGGVRIPIEDADVTRSPEQLEFLSRATAARSASAVWRIVAMVAGGFGCFSVLILWLAITFAHPPTVAALVAGLAALVPFGFAFVSWRRSSACAAEFGPALDKAWATAAADIARARGGDLDAAELAKLTRITEPEADRILARMSAESVVSSSVTAEGNLKYTLVDGASAPPAKHLPAAR